MKHCAVIMAGGGGTRFWPLSRQLNPKQLLNLSGEDIMINEAIKRLDGVVERMDTYIVTNTDQVDRMKSILLRGIEDDNILAEPSARNTAACIGYAAVTIMKKYTDAVMCVFPSDHCIQDQMAFQSAISKGIKIAEEEETLVTIGIKPDYPSTGYGYIQYEESHVDGWKVEAFAEKPNMETAIEYLKSGKYLWNSGMFIWKASTIMNMYKEYLPDIYDQLLIIMDALGTDQESEVINTVYPNIRSISVDYGIMEHANNVKVIYGDFGWSDLGSFDSLDQIHQKDCDGNILQGNHVAIDTSNTVCYSTGRMIASIGVSDIIIVETPDAVLVCDKNRAQDIKCVVEHLKKQGKLEYV